MSRLIAKVSKIQNSDSLHIVEFDFHGQTLSMMSLDIDKNIEIDTRVELLVNPSHIAIAKNFTGELSYSNQLKSTIQAIENGELLSSIHLSCFDVLLESIITASSSRNMDLRVGDSVTAFIKASEISIGKVM